MLRLFLREEYDLNLNMKNKKNEETFIVRNMNMKTRFIGKLKWIIMMTLVFDAVA